MISLAAMEMGCNLLGSWVQPTRRAQRRLQTPQKANLAGTEDTNLPRRQHDGMALRQSDGQKKEAYNVVFTYNESLFHKEAYNEVFLSSRRKNDFMTWRRIGECKE